MEYTKVSCIDQGVDIGSDWKSWVYRGISESLYMGMIAWFAKSAYTYIAQPYFDSLEMVQNEYNRYCSGVNPFRIFSSFGNDKCKNLNIQIENKNHQLNTWLRSLFIPLMYKVLRIVRAYTTGKNIDVSDEVWSLWNAREKQVCIMAQFLRTYYEGSTACEIDFVGPHLKGKTLYKF